MIADVMFAAQHFRHGIIDEWGNYLEVPPAGREEGAVPQQEKPFVSTDSALGRTTATETEKNLACTGAAFTTGVSASRKLFLLILFLTVTAHQILTTISP